MRMPLAERLVAMTIMGVVRVLCDADTWQMEKIPKKGPAILLTNHTSIFEGPVYYILLRGRPKTALAKRELWGNPATRFLMQLWGIIPINREGPDRRALERAMAALHRGEFLGVAGEGTRSPDETLLPGRPGAAMIALQAQVPIIPMVHWGLKSIPRNLLKLRRSRIHFRVGKPFYLEVPSGERPRPKDIRTMADEMMYQLAVLMPEHLRGHYSDLSAMTTRFIRYTGL